MTLFISAFTLILAIALANYLSGRPVLPCSVCCCGKKNN